jgi:hypothetical protein
MVIRFPTRRRRSLARSLSNLVRWMLGLGESPEQRLERLERRAAVERAAKERL